jgi:Cys-rich repeat protein
MAQQTTLRFCLFTLAAFTLSGCFFVDDDRGLACDTVVTECWDICDTYCDRWGCWDECFTECEDTCVSYAPPLVVVDDARCRIDEECGFGHICVDYACVPPPSAPGAGLCEPCLGHATCGEAGALCIELEAGDDQGVCGSPCAQDRDCPSGFECLDAGSSRQCVPTDRVCDGRQSLAECDRDLDCATGEVCDAGECVDAPTLECRNDRDCEEPDVCIGGTCAPLGTCAADSDCADGQACVEQTCVDPSVECQSDRDCAEGDLCIDAACVTPAVRDACDFSADCEDGFCIDGLCRASCEAPSDCEVDETCRGGICAPRPEPECRTGADCGGEAFLCVDGECRDLCRADSDCGFGFICSSGYCADDPAVECREDLECGADQRCEEGMCFFTCRASCNCPNGLTCDGGTGLCEDRPAPETCSTDCDCPSGMSCSDAVCVD